MHSEKLSYFLNTYHYYAISCLKIDKIYKYREQLQYRLKGMKIDIVQKPNQQ